VVNDRLPQLFALLWTSLPHPLGYLHMSIRNKGLYNHACAKQEGKSLLVACKLHVAATTGLIGLRNSQFQLAILTYIVP